MTKADIVEALAGATGLNKADVATAVDLLLETIARALQEREHIELRGFGNFKVKVARARVARNPKTGEQVSIPEKVVPYFKASREFIALVNSADQYPA